MGFHSSRPAPRAILPAIPGVTANAAQSQAEIARPCARVAYRHYSLDSPNVFCVPGAFTAPFFSHLLALSIATSLLSKRT
jgi:hypothetical protein